MKKLPDFSLRDDFKSLFKQMNVEYSDQLKDVDWEELTIEKQILLKGEKIKTVVVFDTEAGKIEQILQDKSRFGFNLIVVSNSYSPLKNETVPYWDWFKEEIEIVDAL